MRILIIGDSVAIRIRPPRKIIDELTYSEIVAKERPQDIVQNEALGSTVVPFKMEEIDKIINKQPDIIIINWGIVDACTRPVSRSLYTFLNTQNPSSSLFITVIKKAFNLTEKKFRRELTLLRGKRSWTSAKAFQTKYMRLIQHLQKDTRSQIICLSINETNSRVENFLPGSKNNIILFNSIIKKLTIAHSINYLDTSKIVSIEEIPDGIHFNAEGHRKIGEAILKVINQNSSNV